MHLTQLNAAQYIPHNFYFLTHLLTRSCGYQSGESCINVKKEQTCSFRGETGPSAEHCSPAPDWEGGPVFPFPVSAPPAQPTVSASALQQHQHQAPADGQGGTWPGFWPLPGSAIAEPAQWAKQPQPPRSSFLFRVNNFCHLFHVVQDSFLDFKCSQNFGLKTDYMI